MPSRIDLNELPAYQRAWAELQAGLPTLDPQHIRSIFGSKIVLNVPGGGCKTIASGSRARGLRLMGIPVSDIFGTSAGCSMGAMYLEGARPDEAAVYFAELVNPIERNFNLRKLLAGESPCPHEPILTATMRKSGISDDLLARSTTNVHIAHTSSSDASYLRGYLRAGLVFFLYTKAASRQDNRLLNALYEQLFDFSGLGFHVPLSRLLAIDTKVLDTQALLAEGDVIEAFMRSSCTPPVTRIRRDSDEKDGPTNYFDGCVTYINLMPLIVRSRIEPTTVLTLLPATLDNYNDGFLGTRGYDVRERIHPDILLCRNPKDETLPPLHLIWGLPEQPMSTWDYTNPQASLDLWTYGYRSLYHFIDALGLESQAKMAS